MNRRSFLSDIIKAGAAAMILPAATTYARTWSGVLVPEYHCELKVAYWFVPAPHRPADGGWSIQRTGPFLSDSESRFVMEKIMHRPPDTEGIIHIPGRPPAKASYSLQPVVDKPA